MIAKQTVCSLAQNHVMRDLEVNESAGQDGHHPVYVVFWLQLV